MLAMLKKWGNAQALRIPKHMLEELQWKENQPVEIQTNAEGLTIKTVKQNHPEKINIVELFADYSGEYKPEEIDWGTAVGKEIW